MHWTINPLCLILCFAVSATPLGVIAQDASLLRYEGPDRVQKVMAAAQKEGALTLYTSFAEKDLPPLLGAFEKRYGIKVKVWRSASEKVLQRALTEATGRRYEVDAIHTSALEMEALHREKILQQVAPPASATRWRKAIGTKHSATPSSHSGVSLRHCVSPACCLIR